ncbi:hypothetical protein Pint_22649 [Pistacia integerrima]|uniref:Uncharacterized protein n=1 Tax=Pistacia integerrima TaxID=434235 RepID=A0ACC0YIR6_9ROSI|nr:hypothetical protein Pint_22649 [Pistacia integerrima]
MFTVLQEMLSILRSHSISVMHLAILNLRKACRFCHTQFWGDYGYPTKRGPASLMLEDYLNHFTSVRILVQNL